jgi:hypothetical protein
LGEASNGEELEKCKVSTAGQTWSFKMNIKIGPAGRNWENVRSVR